MVGEADGSVTLPVTLPRQREHGDRGHATATVAAKARPAVSTRTPVYEGVSGTLTFTPGVTTQDVTVNLLNCRHQPPVGSHLLP